MKSKIVILILLILCTACLTNLFGQTDEFTPEKSFDSLFKQVNICFKKRDLTSAKMVIQSMDSLTGIYWGKNSSQYSLVTYNKAIYAYYKGSLTESMEGFESAMKLRKQLYGEKDEYFYKSLSNSGNIHFVKGDFKTALKIYSKGLALNREIYKEEGINLAKDLNNVAIAYKELGYFENAEEYLLEAIRLKLQYDSNDVISISQSYNNLALLYRAMGNLQKDEENILKAVNRFENNPELKSNQEYLAILTTAGVFYDRLHNYKQAQNFLLKSEEVLEKNPTIRESMYFESYLSLKIQLFNSLGEYSKVKEFQFNLLSFVEKKYGKLHLRYALALMNAGKNLYTNRDYESSKEKYEDALYLLDSIQGRNSVNSIICLTGLAYNAMKTDQFSEMLRMAIEAKSRFEASKHVQDTITYSHIIHLMGDAYSKLHQSELAEEYLLKALNWRESSIGTESEDYLSSLQGIASHFIRKEDYQKGLFYLTEAGKLVRRILEKSKAYMNQEEMSNYVAKFESIYHQLLTLCSLSMDHKTDVIAFENAIFYKGFIKEQLIAFNRDLRTNLKLSNEYYFLRSTEERLSKLYKRVVDEDDRKLIAQLEEKKFHIEKNILLYAEYKQDTLMLDWKHHQKMLSDSSAIVEFVHYNYFKENRTDSILYAAFILRKDSNFPLFIPLCTQNKLDKIIGKHRTRRLEYVNNLYFSATGSGSGASENMYDLVWKNLETHLEGIHQIDYSLSGILHNVNIHFLVSPEKKYLSDLYHLVLHSSIHSTKSVINATPQQSKEEVVLFGGIDYDYDATLVGGPIASQEEQRDPLRSIGSMQWSQADTGYHISKWTYLPFSHKEVKRIRDICMGSNVKSSIYSGIEASEEKFKSLGSYRSSNSSPFVIHLSTHGFFFSDLDSKSSVLNYRNIVNHSSNPMLRSGLLLAGANKSWFDSNAALSQSEDGVLSADEISLMDLSATKLVILSACESGLGEIQGNEGVYGLQRAFKIAGVQSMIMSLWQVPDKQTAELMELFYENWLVKGMSIRISLQTAQKTLRDKRLEPYYWAGFILLE
ncbi:MAG: CHAT domain-containing protein [Saprospiraceae bacterium]|nr:CHAT domain-containing protein [Saprospiraceae bacterium]MBK7810026.1 CHAT domain-containing protein [Saprospiraceae bacterium]MBK9629627.1 CHAT domain-containing protein [Saprospiraceae bacterium]